MTSRTLLILLTLALASCGEASPEPAPPELPPQYQAKNCADFINGVGPDLECGTITVAQNRVRAVDRDVEIFLVRPAVDTNPGKPPLIVLAGGPGAPHVEFAARTDLPSAMSELLNRTVIYVDQRGIGLSTPSTACPELDGALTDVAEIAAWETCVERFEHEGIDIDSFNTLENAADIAAIPEALSVDRIDLFAGSYATRLALQVVARHPDAVETVVLGGLTPPRPGLADEDDLETFSELIGPASADFKARCAADSECAALLPNFDFLEVLNKLVALMMRDGSVNILGRDVTNVFELRAAMFPLFYLAQVRNMTFAALYHAGNETSDQFYAHMGQGDAATGRAFVRNVLMKAQEAVFGGSSGMSVATRCYDGEGCGLLSSLREDYSREEFTTSLGSDHSIFVLSGGHDVATPAALAEAFMPKLPNGKRSVFSCLGHDVSRISNRANGSCLIDQVKSFLEDPEAPLPQCVESMCDALPLAPDSSDITTLLRDYVADF